jgi:hypothetical protein
VLPPPPVKSTPAPVIPPPPNSPAMTPGLPPPPAPPAPPGANTSSAASPLANPYSA